jgi:hypothetical protein
MKYGWTLNKDSWKRLIAAIGKRSWQKVPFTKLERAEVPESYGVYVFCTKPCPSTQVAPQHLLRDLFNAIYVGQATNLRQRFDYHRTTPMAPMEAVRECFSTTLEFWFTTLESSAELCRVESLLIECLGPTANRQKGPGLEGKLGAGRPA